VLAIEIAPVGRSADRPPPGTKFSNVRAGGRSAAGSRVPFGCRDFNRRPQRTPRKRTRMNGSYLRSSASEEPNQQLRTIGRYRIRLLLWQRHWYFGQTRHAIQRQLLGEVAGDPVLAAHIA
jgi:hypothetical protein